MNIISLISPFGMIQGPFEASESKLEVKRTSLEFDLGSFVQKNTKKDLKHLVR